MKQFILTTGCVLTLIVSLSFFAQSANAQGCSSCASGIAGGRIAGGGFGHGGPLRSRIGGGKIRGQVRDIANDTAAYVRGPVTDPVVDGDGRVQSQTNWLHPRQTLTNAAQDAFSPNPVYAYSPGGLEAGETHSWNQRQSNAYSWHGGYNSWRFGQPTALVVPPTASYQSSYAWGVGQTRSTPIHHQFGRGAGSAGGVSSSQNTPYHPYSTNQFGYYPVRASW